MKSLRRRSRLLSVVGGNGRDEKTPRVLPKAERRCFGINVDQRPPCFLVHLAVQLAVVNAAQRDSELVADLAAKGARLHEAEMVGIAGLATTHQTRQRGNEIEVLLVANPPRLLWHRSSAISARILRREPAVFLDPSAVPAATDWTSISCGRTGNWPSELPSDASVL